MSTFFIPHHSIMKSLRIRCQLFLYHTSIDFALKKDTTENPPRYLVFFKGRDADVLTAAFKEFSAKKLTQEKKPSIRKLLSSLKEKAAGLNAQRDKVKNKDREVSL